MPKDLDPTIPNLGTRSVASPIVLSREHSGFIAKYVSDESRVLYDIVSHENDGTAPARNEMFERAGPREKIYFEPAKVHAAVVTCGGLCPGINDVIRAIVMCLWYRYGVRRISGIRFGYAGLLPEYELPAMNLTPDEVVDIHRKGGTLLGSSRGGGQRFPEIVDTIERMNLNVLFTIGGDGTQRGALDIAEEARRRKLKLAVVGVPKTIDNDLSFIDKSFGFETAVAEACKAICAAHVEAKDALHGVGIVKVMGRHSGFIAAHTALAINDVNYVLIPEVPFDLEGEKGLLADMKARVLSRNHAVVLVAEGAGQDLLEAASGVDASGNRKLGDIGAFLAARIKEYFAERNTPLNLKYIDPGYMIRSAPANPADSLYCARLGHNAVHAAMAGKSGILISLVNNQIVHVPIPMAVSQRNCVDPEGSLWFDVVEATGQPLLMKNPAGSVAGKIS